MAESTDMTRGGQSGASRIIGLNYGPFRTGQAPWGPFPTEAQIDQDMQILSQSGTRIIRVYNATAPYDTVVKVAERYGIQVVLEAYLSTNTDANFTNINAAIALARKHPETVASVFCGQEVFYRGDLTLTDFMGYLQMLLKGIPGIPLGYADTPGGGKGGWQTVLNAPAYQAEEFFQMVQWVGLDSYGFWQCQPETSAVDITMGEWKGLSQSVARWGRAVMIMETEWPNQYPNPGCPAIVGSPSLQNDYTGGILAATAAQNIDLFLFEFSDELWKQQAAGNQVAGAWGLWTSDRSQAFEAWTTYKSWVGLKQERTGQ